MDLSTELVEFASLLDPVHRARLAARWGRLDRIPADPARTAAHAVIDDVTAAAVAAMLPAPAPDCPPPSATHPCLVCHEDLPDDGQPFPLCDRHRYPPALDGRAAGHGLRRGLRGCRCRRCLRDLADAYALVAGRVAGVTLAQLSAARGLTRERARQVTEQAAPWKPWRAVAAERAAHAEDHARCARISAAQAVRETPCKVCGGPLQRRRRAYCSARCRDIEAMLRRHVDPDTYARHRTRVASWNVRHADGQAAWAEAVLAGDAPPSHDRSGLTFGSRTWAAAVVAARDSWPIADGFRPDVAAQLRSWLERHPGEDPYDHVVERPDELSDRAWLRRAYVTDGRSLVDIATSIGVAVPTVAAALDRFRLRAPRSQSRQLRYPQLSDRVWLVAQVRAGRTDRDIAEEVGCSIPGAQAARRRYGLPAGSRVAAALRTSEER
jgi:hypothetical protein